MEAIARPVKSGVDYFPFDVHLDEKFDLIEAEFGLTGFAVVVKLFQKIYGLRGYYCEWTNEVALLFGRTCGLGGNAVSEIVRASVKRGIFDQEMFDKYGILTSKGIQDRYFEAVSRRANIEVDTRYLLRKPAQNLVSVCKNGVNVDINPENVRNNPQIKEKEIKENNNTCAEECDSSAPAAPVFELPLNDGTVFPISEELAAAFAGLYPNVNVPQELREMKGWLIANPKRRKTRFGVMRFITAWLAKEQDKGGNKKQEAKVPSYDLNAFEESAMETPVFRARKKG